MTGSLLPANSTPTERAMEALAAEVRDLPVPIRSLWNPATCPVAFLPWLAWALSVDTWRSDWPEATKRAVIAASPRVHRLKGTVAAVKAALAALGVTARVIEWFQPGGSGVPYTATIETTVPAPTAGSGSRLVADIESAALASAPLRTHLTIRVASASYAGISRVAHVRRPVTAAYLKAEVA